MRILAAMATAALLALTGCQRGPAVHEYSFFAFGTLVELTVVGANPETAEAARAHAAARLDQWHHDWHAWQPGPLTRLNAALGAGETVPVPEALQPILSEARRLSLQSGGLFNPAIGKLVALWGFHADEVPSGPPPEPTAVRELVAQDPNMADLVLEDGRARSNKPALQLDLGAFAKGSALQSLSAELADMGLEHFLLNAGGDLVALGTRGERPWRIGIRDPVGTGVLAELVVDDGEAVFTSGDYERYFEWEGKRYHHIIDPRTGYPARGLRSVTVITRDAALGDAAATALFVAGPEDWPNVARALNVSEVLAVETSGEILVTPSMNQRVQFVGEPGPHVQVIEP